MLDVACGDCGRKYALDEDRASGLNAARCECGQRIALRPQAAANKLGKYVLLNRVAVGGMGEIFYGKMAGVAGFEREVAIKKMLPHLSADESFINMIIKEAKLTVLLNHPNIVQVFDLAKEGKEYYIAMEYVDGINVGTLLEVCRKNGRLLPWEVAVHIAMQVLLGLSYAHNLKGADGEPMNVLHRDITPQNILITRDAWVKITDFGIAKARNEISTTSPGMIKGKLGYIAPEQLAGEEADQRLDVFCAGILAWEAMASRRLFKGPTEIDTFRIISEARVPPLSEIRLDVPAEVEHAIRKALSRERDLRYQTAEEFYIGLNQAIFPNTADDCRSATAAFLAEHPDLFESIDDAKNPDSDGTSELEVASDTNLVDVKKLRALTEKPTPVTTPRSSPFRVALGIIVLFVALGVASAFGWRALRFNATPAANHNSANGSTYTQEEVQLAVDGEGLRLKECYAQGSNEFRKQEGLRAHFVIPSTGGVTDVSFEPADELAEVGTCLTQVLSSMRFRPHGQPRFEADVALPAPTSTLMANRDPRGAKSANSGRNAGSGRASKLTGPEIQRVVKRNQSAIARCLRTADRSKAPGQVNATIAIDPSGRVSRVDVRPAIGTPAAESCLNRALRAMRFRRHPDKGFSVTIPLKIEVRGG